MKDPISKIPRLAVFLLLFLGAVEKVRAQYDVDGRLPGDLSVARSVEFCELAAPDVYKAYRIFEPYQKVGGVIDVFQMKRRLAHVPFTVGPGIAGRSGRPIYMAFLNRRKDPLFIVKIYPESSRIELAQACRDLDKKIRGMDANVRSNLPRYAAEDTGFVTLVEQMQEKYGLRGSGSTAAK